MGYMVLTCVVFALATAVNSASVYIQKRYRLYSQRRYGWLLHSLVILPLWALFVYLLLSLNAAYTINFHAVPITGYLCFVLALLIFGIAIHQLGWQSLLNGNWFGQGQLSHGGIFRVLKNPIYDSYLLGFIGASLTTGNAAYLIIAIESYIGLNLIESHIEQIKDES